MNLNRINISAANARNQGIESAIKDDLPHDTIMALVNEHLDQCKLQKRKRAEALEYWENLIQLRRKHYKLDSVP